MNVVDRALRDLERGEPWMARDRLRGALAGRRTDPVLLETLGRTHAAMNDLPSAGACWFLGDRADDDPLAAPAIAALRARYPRRVALVGALPALGKVSDYAPEAQRRLAALQAELREVGWTWEPPARPVQVRPGRRGGGGPPLPPRTVGARVRGGTLGFALLAFVVLNVAFYVLGIVAVVRWLW